jgi:hypothetical protein
VLLRQRTGKIAYATKCWAPAIVDNYRMRGLE